MRFRIQHPKLTLKLSLEPVDRLHIHEEVIESALRRLVEEIRADRVVKHPVIVDEKTMVVLDGMHRVAALKELGCRLIPACLVDYDNPNILVSSWCRGIAGEDLGRAVRLIEGLGLEVVSRPFEEAVGMLGGEGVVAVVVSNHGCLTVHGDVGDVKDVYDEVKRMESALRSGGYRVEYLTEEDALRMARSGRLLASIVPPKVSKEAVRRVALRGEVFAHKTTRHVIPARPMFLNVPLDWLRMGYEEANRLLYRNLSGRRVRRLPGGTVLDRRYEEELYVFE